MSGGRRTTAADCSGGLTELWTFPHCSRSDPLQRPYHIPRAPPGKTSEAPSTSSSLLALQGPAVWALGGGGMTARGMRSRCESGHYLNDNAAGAT